MLSSTTVRATVQGFGSAGPFSFPFKIFAATDLLVQKTSATGVISTLAYPTDYTVTGVGDAAGGTLTLAVALATGETLAVVRATPFTQPTSLRVLGTFFPGTHEDALDRLTMLVQQHEDRLHRAVTLAPSIDPAGYTTEILLPVANQVLAWNANGTGFEARTIDTASATLLPGHGRSVASLTAYLANNAAFNPVDYGADPTGVADSSAALVAWAAAINAAGGGEGIVPPGTYKVSPPSAAFADIPTAPALCAFQNLVGLTLRTHGATFVDTNTYPGSTDQSVLFSFTACTNLRLGHIDTTSANFSPYPTRRGLITTMFLQGCANVVGDITVTGGQKGAYITREYTDPAAYRSANFDLRINGTNVEYPLLCRFSGDNVRVAIDANGCGRSYYVIGCAHHAAYVRAKNQTGSTVIGAFNGFGCSDIEMWYSNTDTDAGVSTSEAVLLQYSDVVPSTFRNITIHFDVVNNVSSPFYHTLTIDKINTNPTGPGANGGRDVLGRGHVLDGLTIDGYSQQIDGIDHIDVFGYFTPGSDVVRNVNIKNFTAVGSTSAHVRLGNLLSALQGNGLAHFRNVTCSAGLFGHESGTVIGATNATPIVLSFGHEQDLCDGMQISISNVGGNANANGVHFVQRVTPTTYALYSDQTLTTPIAGSGAYTSGGTFVVSGTAGSHVIYTGCHAANFTDSAGDFGVHDYIACEITSGATQSTGTTKNFLNTSIAGVTTWVKNTVQVGFQYITGAMLLWGVNTPEGAVTAPTGSLYLRTNGGASTTLYIKESGTGNTGWIAK